MVACVAKINGIIKRDDMRMGFIGKPIHGDYDNWIGKTLERNDSKNPIAYFDERAILPPAKSLKTLKSLIANLRILAQRHVKRADSHPYSKTVLRRTRRTRSRMYC